jgi:hypothetical protein
MKTTKLQWMPAIIVFITLTGFYSGGGYILIKAFNPETTSIVDTAKAMSLLDMIVIAAISLATGSVGYWLGTTHSSKMKDELLLNSTPVTPPTEGQ